MSLEPTVKPMNSQESSGRLQSEIMLKNINFPGLTGSLVQVLEFMIEKEMTGEDLF